MKELTGDLKVSAAPSRKEVSPFEKKRMASKEDDDWKYETHNNILRKSINSNQQLHPADELEFTYLQILCEQPEGD